MGTISRFADLHCHPHMRSFNWLHKHRRPEKKSKYNPWYIILSKTKPRKKGARAAAYSQCDMAKVINGNLKLGFLSLYPLEKGWVSGRNDSKKEIAKNLNKFLNKLKLNGEISIESKLIIKLNKLLKFVGDDKKGALAVRDIIQAIYMKIPLSRVNFVQSKKFDYFKELLEEKKFLDKKNGVKTKSKIFVPLLKKLTFAKKKLTQKQLAEMKAKGTYILAKDGEHVKSIINDNGNLNDKKTVFVLTIEGANVFNTHEDFESIIEKINLVKNWDEPVFFITFTHHFDNFLAGHAHSIPDIGNLLLDQTSGMDEGFSSKGLNVLRHFLSLDENNEYKPDEFGHRIIIDVKHLNVKSRKEYYKDFVLPSLSTDNPIPVVASHVAFSGKQTLQELINGMPDENEDSKYKRRGHEFNSWNINLCDEDVINIFKSKGLIGINLDQRVLGVSKEKRNNADSHANYIWQNIKGMMLAIVESTDSEINSKKEVTNLFCLGTDFDGFIDPINKYPTVLEFEQLGDDLIEVIKNDPDKVKLLFGLDEKTFVQKFCFDNAYDFVVKNFKK